MLRADLIISYRVLENFPTHQTKSVLVRQCEIVVVPKRIDNTLTPTLILRQQQTSRVNCPTSLNRPTLHLLLCPTSTANAASAVTRRTSCLIQVRKNGFINTAEQGQADRCLPYHLLHIRGLTQDNLIIFLYPTLEFNLGNSRKDSPPFLPQCLHLHRD